MSYTVKLESVSISSSIPQEDRTPPDMAGAMQFLISGEGISTSIRVPFSGCQSLDAAEIHCLEQVGKWAKRIHLTAAEALKEKTLGR